MTRDLSACGVQVIGPEMTDELLVPITAMLAEQGARVARYDDMPSAQADEPMLAATDIIVAMAISPITRAAMERMSRLRAIVVPVTGIEHIDRGDATDRTVAIVNGQVEENFVSMAEATAMLILAGLYDLPRSMRMIAPGTPRGWTTGRMLAGKTVGLIGYGKIARSLMDRLASWQVRWLVHTPIGSPVLPPDARTVPLRELFVASDVICVLCSLSDRTQGMIDGDLLRLLKPDALLVNVSRGKIIDEAALIDCARARPDIRLALDVFETEPLPAASGLRTLPNAILTPHRAGHTQETMAALRSGALDHIRQLMDGSLPALLCNPEVAADWNERWGSQSNKGRL